MRPSHVSSPGRRCRPVVAALLLTVPGAAHADAQDVTFHAPLPEQVVDPSPLVADASGDVYVLGRDSSNLFELGADGSITLVADPTVDLPAPFMHPTALALDSQGNVYVTCRTTDNVFRFTPSGEASVILDDTGDGLGNPLFDPSSVAVDAADNVWVASRTHDVIFSVTPGGVVTLEMDASGLGPGTPLVDPRVVGSRGRVFALADEEVFELSVSAPPVELIGPAGAGGFTLDTPLELEVDPIGRVYVRDANNVFRVATSGAVGPLFSQADDMAVDGTGSAWFLVDVTGPGVSPFLVEREVDGDILTYVLDEGTFHTALSADEAGNAYFVRRGVHPDGDSLWVVPEGGVPTLLAPSAAPGAAGFLEEGGEPIVAADGAVWLAGDKSWNVLRVAPSGAVTEVVPPPDFYMPSMGDLHVDAEGRVVMTAGSDVVLRFDPGTEAFEVLAGPDAPGVDVFDGLVEAVTDPDGAVWVTSLYNDRVYRIDPDGDVVLVMDGTGDGVHALDGPHAIAVDVQGDVFVTGAVSDNVFRIATDGTIAQVVGPEGDGLGHPLEEPEAVAVGPAGEVYVAGYASSNVLRLDPDGTVTEILDATGDGGGNTLAGPEALAVTADGTLYVTARSGGFAVFERTPAGDVTAVLLPDDGTLLFPEDVFVDAFGSVYVVSNFSRDVLRRDPDGTVTQLVAPSGTWPLGFPVSPYNLTVTGSGDVFVTGYGLPYLLELDQADWFADLGGSSPGIAGRPELRAKGVLSPGTPQDRVLRHAPPNALMLAWIAFASTPLDAIGGTVHAFPPNVQLFYVADAVGSSSLSVTWPAGIPSGIDLYLQFIVQDLSVPDGLTLSNAVLRTTP